MSAASSSHARITSCPACASAEGAGFYTQDSVPIHSCRLLPDRAEAVALARRPLDLGVCARCGFVWNRAFDPSVHDYSLDYEETQGFSPRFRSFAVELATRLVERYDIRGKRVLEIGSGKGEFLALMCELGGNEGIGIDPSFEEDRLESPALDRMTFIKDYYGEQHADVEADVIVCRHTLEHILPVADFLELVRMSIGARKEPLVFLEVPDTGRILRDLAFWDIYYEHCSYFTPGSLAQLFRRTGFEILDLSLDFDDQYILIECLPSDGPAGARFDAEEAPADVVAAATRFAARVPTHLAQWRRALAAWSSAGERTVLWGSGSKGVAFLNSLAGAPEIELVVDINPFKHGKAMAGSGQPIVPPERLADYRPHRVVVVNSIYSDEIARMLAGLGVAAKLLPIESALDLDAAAV